MPAGMKSISASVAAGENTPHLDMSDFRSHCVSARLCSRCSAAYARAGGPSTVTSSRKATKTQSGYSAATCCSVAWKASAKTKGPRGSPCCAPSQLSVGSRSPSK